MERGGGETEESGGREGGGRGTRGDREEESEWRRVKVAWAPSQSRPKVAAACVLQEACWDTLTPQRSAILSSTGTLDRKCRRTEEEAVVDT